MHVAYMGQNFELLVNVHIQYYSIYIPHIALYFYGCENGTNDSSFPYQG